MSPITQESKRTALTVQYNSVDGPPGCEIPRPCQDWPTRMEPPYFLSPMVEAEVLVLPKYSVRAPLSFPQLLDETLTCAPCRDGRRTQLSFHRLIQMKVSARGGTGLAFLILLCSSSPDSKDFSSSFPLRMQERMQNCLQKLLRLLKKSTV